MFITCCYLCQISWATQANKLILWGNGSHRLLRNAPLIFRSISFLLPFMLPLDRKPSEYITAILELSALVVKRNEQLLLHIDPLYRLTPDGMHFYKACRLVHDFTDAVIQKRRQTLPSHGGDDVIKAKAKSKTLDFIDVLLLSKVSFLRGAMDLLKIN